jgi:hypothetical protein
MKKGRPKGYSPYIDITYDELGDWLGRKSLVKVSKAWLDELRGFSEPSDVICSQESKPIKETLYTPIEPKEIQPKIEFNLTTFDDE